MVIGNTGFWPMPNLIGQFIVSQNITINPFPDPDIHYIYTNYFQPAIFSLFGGNSFISYVIYVSVITVIFLALFSFWFIGHHGKNISLNQYKLLAALTFPVFSIPFYWIGMDGMTLLLMLFVMISFSYRWTIIPAIFLGTQHFEQGIAAVSLLAVTLLLNFIMERNKETFEPLKSSLLIFSGIIIGKAILVAWFYVIGIDFVGSRVSYLEKELSYYLVMWNDWWFYIVWSLLGVGWLLLIAKIKFLWIFLISVLVVFGFTSLVADQTRVGTIILFPSLFYWILMNKTIWEDISKHFVISLIIIYLIIPVVVVWEKPYGSLWRYDIEVAKQFSKNELTIDDFDWLYPFKSEDN